MSSHWYSPVKAESGYAIVCHGCGDVAGQQPTELEALAAATRINKEIEASFRPEGRTPNPASLGLARRMRMARKARHK